MRLTFWLSIFLWSLIQTYSLADINSTSFENNLTEKTLNQEHLMIKQLIQDNENIDNELLENNIWSKIYSNYHTYEELKKQEKILNRQIKKKEKKKKLSKVKAKELEQDKVKIKTLLGKLQLLKEYEDNPFKKFLTPPDIGEIPTVSNPLAVIGALSFQKKLNSDQNEYTARYRSLQNIIKKLKNKEDILIQLMSLEDNPTKYIKSFDDTQEQIKTFSPVIDIFKTTNNVYIKKLSEISLNLNNDIKREIEKTITIGAIVLFLILLLLLMKYIVRRYMSDNDRFYTINKALNITFIVFTLFTLLFAYIENVSYLVTILGFASAGIAIAMKDWFMSLMGWLTIVIGGSVHVGDRVKFVRDGVEYVGDVVDISLLRITMHEDVTYTTYTHNRRSGRIIFIPNNFIFTDMIANYSHSGLKTVWDGIDFMITFDSDIQKATSIAKEVSRKYSKGYTDITRKQLNKLRSSYSIRNTNVDPRVFSFIEPYGMKISVWYLTNSYATLTLRSTISAEIIRQINEESSIRLAFPTQSIYVDKDVPKPAQEFKDIPMGEITF